MAYKLSKQDRALEVKVAELAESLREISEKINEYVGEKSDKWQEDHGGEHEDMAGTFEAASDALDEIVWECGA